MAERSPLAARVAAIAAASSARGPLSWTRAALLAGGVAAVFAAIACARPSPPAEGSAGAPSAALAPVSEAPRGASSTIDSRLQRIADEEIDRTVAEWKAVAGTILVLEPYTGEVLASAGREQGAPADVAAQRAYVTGSTLKTITLAAALEEGVVGSADHFDCETRAYGARTLHDAKANGLLTVPEMLAVSTNVGFSRVFDRLGGERLGRWLRRFHFGAAPPLAGAIAGEVPARIEDATFEGAMVAIGQSLTASPLQMAAAYAVVANGGAYVPPTLARSQGGSTRETILRPDTASTLMAMLEGVVSGERSTGKLAAVPGTRVAGKTGTASFPLPGGGEGTYASFVGIVPADRPRLVVLVGIEGPREGGTGGTAAAPAFARIASRALQGD
jgi:cell division protein FtsI (penicillin-binding protein 3)